LTRLRLQPVHDALKQMLSAVEIQPLIEAAEQKEEHPTARDDRKRLVPDGPGIESAITEISHRARELFRTIEDQPAEPAFSSVRRKTEQHAWEKRLGAAALIPLLVSSQAKDWPATARAVLPSHHPLKRASALWAPVIAWSILQSLGETSRETVESFDRLHLRGALAEAFSTLGLEGEDAWRAAARVRLLLSGGHETSGLIGKTQPASPALWDEPDVRWLLAVNESEGTLYFNKECLEELFWWLQLPELVEQLEARKANAPVDAKPLVSIKARFSAEVAKAARSGYKLKSYLAFFEDEAAKSRKAPPAESKESVASSSPANGNARRDVDDVLNAEVEEQVREVEE
jgi:hypothetical protein